MAHEKDKMVTGQVFIRDYSGSVRVEGTQPAKAPDGSNRRLLCIAGLIAVPLNCPLIGEHQYEVFGTVEGSTLRIMPHGRRVYDSTVKLTIDGILTSPMWRI
jgi:hypothetical protein